LSLTTDAALVIYCDFAGKPVEHDAWHSDEHLRERLSIPGFVRGTRWARASGSPRYMIVYEVDDAAITQSPAYLARLNDPSPWTRSIMPRVTGMARTPCRVATTVGYGLGGLAMSMRFRVAPGLHDQARASLSTRLQTVGCPRGVVSVLLLEPAAPAPMTEEQSLRGRDAQTGWVLVATGCDGPALEAYAAAIWPDDAKRAGIALPSDNALFSLQHTVTAVEALRTPEPA
jgi:hypothetical protein